MKIIMKNQSLILIVLMLLAVGFMGCDEEQDLPFDAQGAVISLANVAGFFDKTDPSSVFSFDANTIGEAVSSFDILKSYNGSDPVLHSSGNSPSTISITLAEALEGLNVSIDDLSIGDEITFSFDNLQTSSGAFKSGTATTAGVACASALAGTYDYTTEGWCGETSTGQATWTEVGPGTYEIDDWSYGSYPACYGGFMAASWGELQLVDVCNQISINGLDNYSETWTFPSITVDGADLTLSWRNTYMDEAGTTTLTRTDGTEWPPLFQ